MNIYQFQLPITRNELARLYQITNSTLRQRLDRLGIKRNKRLTSTEVDRVLEVYGPVGHSNNTITKTSSSTNPTILYHPIRRKKLAQILAIDPRILSRWVKEAGITHSKTLDTNELRLFFLKYGMPAGYCVNFELSL